MFEIIKEIKEKKHQEINGEMFIVMEKHFLDAKNGDKYIGLKLKDKSGIIEAKIWKNLYHLHENFKEGDFVKLKAKTNYYKDNWQLIIENIEKIEVDETIKDEFLPKTKKDIEVLTKELFAIINGTQNQAIKKLLLSVFEEDEFFAKFKKAPAAKSMHHAYIGGLMEHTISVAKIAKEIAKFYMPIDTDILVAGALLHDIGKVYEIDASTFNYTNEGKLIGHIVIGYNLVKEKIKNIKLSNEQEVQILHCILAHHGEYEYGSPKIPKTKEALLLHLIDTMDSKMEPLQNIQANETNWSESIKILGRSFFVPKTNKTEELTLF
ncbi:MAG: 3'-5' exoribonuclease YhaM family protein [Desulfurella sp.]|uniref:3'-5' exoribonuclease YhaM family protein n=1 Tax=Desulfurella sp. TaxID=1962857 RepID=UPI003C9810BC